MILRAALGACPREAQPVLQRFIADRSRPAELRALAAVHGWTFLEGESLLAEVDDRPGGMARIARELSDAGVNVLGHLFLGRWSDRATFAFVVDDPDKARPILERR